jgi:hypothetical protein
MTLFVYFLWDRMYVTKIMGGGYVDDVDHVAFCHDARKLYLNA